METIIYSLYLEKLEKLQQFERKIILPPFGVMLTIAFSLHIIGILIIGYMMPKATPIAIPIRQLTLHLGGGKDVATKLDDKLMSDKMAQALQSIAPAAAPAMPPTPSKAIIDAPKPKPLVKKEKPSTRTLASAPKVVKVDKALEENFKPRDDLNIEVSSAPSATPTASSTTSSSGSSAIMQQIRTQEMMLRYEQKLSAWINRYKVYPPSAFQQGIQGNVLLRIRIDRAGYIKFILIQESSGHDMLDQAVISAAKQANPVPAVPTDYPGGQLLEFLIPVKFALK